MLTWHIYPEYGNPSTIYSVKHDFLGKQVMEPLVSYRKKKGLIMDGSKKTSHNHAGLTDQSW